MWPYRCFKFEEDILIIYLHMCAHVFLTEYISSKNVETFVKLCESSIICETLFRKKSYCTEALRHLSFRNI